MDRRTNPYAPGAGLQPPELAGRDPLLENAARLAIDEDRADVIILGSTTMHQAHGWLSTRLDVPVINPGPLTYKKVEMLLGLGLSHSRAAYPVSPVPRDAMIRSMLDAASDHDH